MSSTPRQLGHVRVFRPLGQGGMGSVYAGFDLEAKEFVAVKTLFQELNDDEVAVSLFDHECHLSEMLDHTNVVRFFGAGQEEETRFLALEYVRGTTIADLLETEGRVPPAQVVEFLEDAAAALKHVHDKGIIHRDVKPENIIINQDGILKLIDFGIGVLDYEDPFGDEGMVVGTCTYAAPEQNQGQDIGPQADLYALGAVAWHALTGKRWATGSSPFEIGLQQMAQDVEPPSSLAPDVPEALDRLVLDLMDRDPLERPKSADTVLEVLRAFREEEERKGLSDNIFADPLQGKWSVAKRSFYEKRYALSKSLARYIADRRPDFAPVHFLLGKLFALEKREFNSTDSFRRALELDPDNHEYVADFALSLYRLNMFSLATQELDALVRRAPEHPLGQGFQRLVDEKLEEERAADTRRATEPEEGPSATDLAALDREGVASHEERLPEAEPEAIVAEDLGPAADPEEVRAMSGWFPGLGRYHAGDTAGAVSAALPALLFLGVLGAAWSYPRPPPEGWDPWLTDYVIETITSKSSEIDGWVRLLYGSMQAARAGAALLALLLLGWWWRKEARQAYREAVVEAFRGQVVSVLEDGRLRTSLGSSRGAGPGLVLQVYRSIGGSGRDFVLGKVRLEMVDSRESVGAFRPDVGVTDQPVPGDRIRVSARHFDPAREDGARSG